MRKAIIILLLLSSIGLSVDITKTLKPFHNGTEGAGCSHVPISKPSPATPIGSGLASENCTNNGQTLELQEIQYNATRFSDNIKAGNSAQDPIFPTFIFGFNFTGSYTGTLTNITILAEVDATITKHAGIRTYIYDFVSNTWVLMNETLATTQEYTVVFNVSNFARQNRTSAGGIEIYVQVQANKTSGAVGSPMIRNNDGVFYCEVLSYSLFEALTEYDYCYLNTNNFFYISEEFKDEYAVIQDLQVFKLSDPIQRGYDYVFDGRMKLEPLDRITYNWFNNADWEVINALLKLPFMKEWLNIPERMEKELGAWYGDVPIRVKGNPLNHDEFQTYRIKYKEGEKLRYNPDLLEIKNERKEPHYKYTMTEIKTDFIPFTLMNDKRKIDIEDKGLFLVKIKGWYKPNAYIPSEKKGIIKTLSYFWDKYNNPDFEEIISDHETIQIDRIYANFTYTQDTDTTNPAVSFINPINNSVFYVNETISFIFNFTDKHGIVSNCSIWVNNIRNDTTTLIGDSYTMDERFQHTINLSFRDDEIGKNWSIGCYDNSGNLGMAISNRTLNITTPYLSTFLKIPALNFTSNLTINATWNATINATCRLNNCGNVTVAIRYNRTGIEPDTNILSNDSGIFKIINVSGGYPNFDNIIRSVTISGNLLSGESNGTNLLFMNSTNASKIDVFDNNLNYVGIIKLPYNSTNSGGLSYDPGTNSLWYTNSTKAINIDMSGNFIRECNNKVNVLDVAYDGSSLWILNFSYMYGVSFTNIISKTNPSTCAVTQILELNNTALGLGLAWHNNQLYYADFSRINILNTSNYAFLYFQNMSILDSTFKFDRFHNQLMYRKSSGVLNWIDLMNPRYCSIDRNTLKDTFCEINWTINSTFTGNNSYFIDGFSSMSPKSNLFYSNNTHNIQINPVFIPPIGASCTYTGGDWVIDCVDKCSIITPVDVGGNDISITGGGWFSTTSDITNYRNLIIRGVSDTNLCNITCLGGCFKD